MARALLQGALTVVMFAATAPAQQAVDSTARPVGTLDGRLRTEIAILRGVMRSIHAPVADSFQLGNQEIAAGATRTGTMAVARGNLAIRGRVTGDAIVLHGDVIIYPGGSVGGNAIAVDGRVRTVGGVVEGDVRSVRGITGGILARAAGESPSDEPVTTWGAIKLVIGWFAILLAIGIGVLLFAEKNLNGVVSALEQHFSRAFWIGVLTQVAAIPVLLLILVALAISLIGILLVPFAVVAFVIALAGLLTLGFIAVARFTGRAFFQGAPPSRAVHLRSLAAGLVLYLGLWLLAAAFMWNPVVGSVLRAVALAGSWVALTFGLGATMLTRAGTQSDDSRGRRPKPVDEMSWQTPTPVTGVAAARRPVATIKER
jgi:hypothetical protein